MTTKTTKTAKTAKTAKARATTATKARSAKGAEQSARTPRSNGSSSDAKLHVTVPGLDADRSVKAITILQERLAALLDLQLTLKHIHWNVVGVNFISVHEFLDPQVDSVRLMSDAVAERIATLGGSPLGTPGAIAEFRSWSDYDLNRAPTVRHLSALDEVYGGVISSHRKAQAEMEDLDPVTEDLIIGQLRDLEQYQWFVRAHLQDASGDVVFRDSEH
jgi:starvation-inducible DNA-binding protein